MRTLTRLVCKTTMEIQNSFIELIEQSIRNNWNQDALTDYKGITLQYKDVARKIEKLHILFEHIGIKPGDKIALCGRNSANWTATFLGIITYGAVAVPILHEFKADNVHNIVNHSEARMLFVGDQVWENFNEAAMPHLDGIIELKNFDLVVSRSKELSYIREHLNEEFGKRYSAAVCELWRSRGCLCIAYLVEGTCCGNPC